MQQAKAVGPRAGALKYDILTALMVLSCHDSGTDGRLAGRLAVLVTARFNWQRGSFATGQREIARLWGVTERTAKRELAAMRARDWISIKRAAARGRVAEHAIDIPCILEATRPYWPAVGPDFVARMGAGHAETDSGAQVIPFRTDGQGAPTVPDDGTIWAAASRDLAQADPAMHRAWFSTLIEADRTPTGIVLVAPSRFAATYVSTHLIGRVLAAVSARDASIMSVKVIAAF